MTNREFYMDIINHFNPNCEAKFSAVELMEFAENALAKMDHTNESRKAKNAEKRVEKDAEKAPVRAALVSVMGDAEHPMTASELIAAAEAAGLIEAETVKPASIPSLMKPFVEAGEVLKVDVKISGKGNARGYVKA